MNNTVTLKELSDTKIFYKFLDKNNEVKIGDFGLARISKKNPENVPLATQYRKI